MRHLKTTMRLTTADMAQISGMAYRTLQGTELERGEGSVQTMNRMVGTLGLKLEAVLKARAADGMV